MLGGEKGGRPCPGTVLTEVVEAESYHVLLGTQRRGQLFMHIMEYYHARKSVR